MARPLRLEFAARAAAVSGYQRFVAAGIGAASPWQGLKGQI